jgi:signal transduction histidine kinase
LTELKKRLIIAEIYFSQALRRNTFSSRSIRLVKKIMVSHCSKKQPSIPNPGEALKILKDFSIALASIPDLKSLAKMILETAVQAMGFEKASLFLIQEEKGGYHLVESIDLKIPSKTSSLLIKEEPLVQCLMQKGEILLRDELCKNDPSSEWTPVIERMSLLEAGVSIPLNSKGNLIGMLNLGPAPFQQPVTPEEMNWLSTFANLSSIALENRGLAEDMKKSKSHIQRADRLASLGTLTAALAHELRNPMVAIKTFTQLLPERFEDEEFRNYFLQIVSGEVDRISTLVNELLEFARPSDPKVETEDINSILDSILLLIGTGTKKKHIHMVKHLSENLPPVLVDREQIKQVFLNLLVNAIEATDENGQITVQTRPYIKSNGAPYIQIEFADTGCGIPGEYLETIFHPFFTTKHTGSGLGLSISNQIVQEHKGYIDVESQLNKGTTFYVNLPLHQEGIPRRRDF